jgi:LCP family protein required for cell wall assembly
MAEHHERPVPPASGGFTAPVGGTAATEHGPTGTSPGPTDPLDTAQESAAGDGPASEQEPDVTPVPRRRAWARVLVIAGILALVCAAGGIVGGALLANRYEGKVERADILGDVPRPTNVAESRPAMNFLVLGSDSRSPQARGFDATGDRSDTIMIAHISAGWRSAFIFSIPRDSYVYVPPAGDWPGGLNKINAAMSFGGAAHAARTVYELTKIPLDGAFVVNFTGVDRMVEVVGSVRVCLPHDVRSAQTGQVWHQGCHDMGPEEARQFMRTRIGVPGGDFGRIFHQQLVVKALASQIVDAGMLTNPIQLDRLISIAAESVTVDQSTDLRQLILDLRHIHPDNMSFATVPWTRTMQTDAGSSVELDLPAAQELFQAVIEDRTDEWLAAHPQQVPDF